MGGLKQQINLYQPVFRQPKVSFSFSSLIGITGFLVLAMALATGYGTWQSRELEQGLERIESDRQNLSRELEQLRQQLPEPKESAQLKSEIDFLKRRRSDGYAMLDLLRKRLVGNQEGFSESFVALARQHQEELWLRRILLEQGGTRVELDGATVSADAVPRLLQRLASEKAFQGLDFQQVALGRKGEAGELVVFDLVSRPAENTREEAQ